MLLEYYELYPAYYFSSPGLAWDSLLKMTKIELELFTDLKTFNFIESGIRGGISMITTKYAEANNNYMKVHDSEKENKFIMYYDANNLYGGAMCKKLPYGNFK